MKIIFMGTPEFACPTLQTLINNREFEIVAVYTRAPKIAGRGHKLTNSPIHDLALKHGIKVITPKTLRDETIQQEFANFKADAAIVVAYGLILPQIILKSTKFGCINLHPSILPRFRGPSPIQYNILSGDEKAGITIIKMDEGIDSGNILSKTEFLLEKDANYANLAPKLADLGAKMIENTLFDLKNGKITEIPQDHEKATFSKKIDKNDAKIDFSGTNVEIERKIRAFCGSITAFFEYRGEKIKIFAAEIVDKDFEGKKPGEIVDENFTIQCGKGCIRPLILQKPGKKAMKIEEFLLGFRI